MLKIIDYRLGMADRKVRLLSRLNPTNANKEKKRFLYAYKRGIEYNPVLRYKPTLIDLKRLENELKSIYIDPPTEKNERWFFSKYLDLKRIRIIEKIRATQARGTPEFATRTKKMFGTPAKEQLKYAKSYLNPDNCSSFATIQDTINSAGAADILQGHIIKASLSWQVRLRNNISSKVGLDSRSKYLLIKRGEKFSREELASLAVHEIETHIFRKENGETQAFPYLFGQGFAGPPTCEEGLAFYNEMQQETKDPRRFLIVCARTLASGLAYKKSFYKTFSALVKRGLPADYAWIITLRVKRGLSDTSEVGAFAKDHHYLKGYLAIKKYLKDGGTLQSLYVGKINTGTVKTILRLGIKLKDPRYLPRYIQ